MLCGQGRSLCTRTADPRMLPSSWMNALLPILKVFQLFEMRVGEHLG
jgi:hypothetical protein